MVKKELADLLGPGTHASTFGGGPVICQAALAVLKAIKKEKILCNVNDMGKYLSGSLNNLKIKHPQIKQVRGLGLMWGMELNTPGKALVEECIKNRLLINCTHDVVLRIMPALNVTKKEIDKAVGILDYSLSKL